MEDGKIDLIGTLCIRGMQVRPDGRGVGEEEVEHIAALVLVGADDPCIHRDVVDHQRVGDNALLQADVRGSVAALNSGRRVSNVASFRAVSSQSPACRHDHSKIVGCPDASRSGPYPPVRVAEMVDEVHPPEAAPPSRASARRYTT